MNGSYSKSEHPLLIVVLNGEPQIEYDRSKPLPDQQRAYLDRMDFQMDGGIVLGGQTVEQPDQLQRAQFISIHAIQALQQGNEALVAASCAYLATRMPDLKQIKARMVEGGLSVELVFDKPHIKEETVRFVTRPGV